MIYVEPSQLGWRALHASFGNVLKEKILPEMLELLEELIQWLVPAVLKFVKHPSRRLFIVTSDIYLYHVSNINYILRILCFPQKLQ
jgi:dynein heavy chain